MAATFISQEAVSTNRQILCAGLEGDGC